MAKAAPMPTTPCLPRTFLTRYWLTNRSWPNPRGNASSQRPSGAIIQSSTPPAVAHELRSTSLMMPYWLDFDRPKFPTLAGDASAGVAIIGAGIAGLKLARCLGRYGLSVIVLEGSHVGAGASSRNQGTINHGPNLGYKECIELHSRQTARDLWQLGLENHRLLKAQIADYAIDCDYEVGGMTFLVRPDFPGWESRLAACRDDFALLREDGFDVDLLDEGQARRAGGNPLYVGGLRYHTDAQFHAGRFVVG